MVFTVDAIIKKLHLIICTLYTWWLKLSKQTTEKKFLIKIKIQKFAKWNSSKLSSPKSLPENWWVEIEESSSIELLFGEFIGVEILLC